MKSANSSLFLFSSGLQWVGWCPLSLGRENQLCCVHRFTRSAHPKHPPRHIQKSCVAWEPFGPVTSAIAGITPCASWSCAHSPAHLRGPGSLRLVCLHPSPAASLSPHSAFRLCGIPRLSQPSLRLHPFQAVSIYLFCAPCPPRAVSRARQEGGTGHL